MEADPGTFDKQRLQQYRSLGVNRLSMGVQYFNQVGAAAGGHSRAQQGSERACAGPAALQAAYACSVSGCQLAVAHQHTL